MEPASKRIKPDPDVIEEDNRDAVKKKVVKELEAKSLVIQRRLEVERLAKELQEAQKRLSDAEAILAEIQHKHESIIVHEMSTPDSNISEVKIKFNSDSPQSQEDGYGTKYQSKPQLSVPPENLKMGAAVISTDVNKTTSTPCARNVVSSHIQYESAGISLRSKGYRYLPHVELVNISESEDSEDERPMQKPDHRDHADLITDIQRSKCASSMNFHQTSYISSQHKRKLRSLVINPCSGHLCATSALDAVVNIWKIQEKGLALSLLSTIQSVSPGQRRWPEDMTWHPNGEKLFAAYSADEGDEQVSIINMDASKVIFLDEKPHTKGIINSIVFMPWDDVHFATGGSDHAVVLWSKEEDSGWKPNILHRNLHTSAVMGIAGMPQKQMVLSVGVDKRIIGYDVQLGKLDFKHMLESKAMGVLLNPIDMHLFMVQTGAPERQLRLFDIRIQKEIHGFGWKQETSDSQSALIRQTWSPDGLYISSGSADPKIHVFDIRYNSQEPCQSLHAHQRRVFKAAWHYSLPLLISISSDLQIGLHRYDK